MSYSERLDRINAETVELRRLKYDRTMMFCIRPRPTRGFIDNDCDSLFAVVVSPLILVVTV